MTTSIVAAKQNNCQAKPDYTLRLIPGLSVAAFREKRTKELALWHCLRRLDFNNKQSGHISLEKALRVLVEVYNYTPQTAYRTLQGGQGDFWQLRPEKQGSTIEIYGLKGVAMMFNTRLIESSRIVKVEPQHFRTLKDRRAALWASIHRPNGSHVHPISRDTLADITHVSKRQQKRYDTNHPNNGSHALVRRIPNFRPGCEQLRLPNSYHSRLNSVRGMLRKVKKQIKASIQAEPFEKFRYFTRASKLVSCKHKVELSYLLIPRTKRQIERRLEWEPVFSMI